MNFFGIEFDKRLTLGSLITAILFLIGLVFTVGQRSHDMDALITNDKNQTLRISLLEEQKNRVDIVNAVLQEKLDNIIRVLAEVKADIQSQRTGKTVSIQK